jgi:FkbM family methyltransferase
MDIVKELFAKLLRLRKVIKGIDRYIKKDINIDTESMGNEFASWTFYPSLLNEKSVVYSFGVGDDISFDLALINKFDLQVFAFDPTPKSVDWVATQNITKQFVFHPVGVADFDGKAKFNPPKNPNHISATIVTRPETKDMAYKVDVLTVKSIMQQLGHRHIDLLKMDIEGAEYQVIDDMMSKNIKPDQILIEFHHRFKNIGSKKTVNTVKQLRNMGYLVFHISKTGEEISFIKADLLNQKPI